MIQFPRLYETYKESGAISCFQDMLDNIFLPLFEVSADPSADPKLHQFLCLVVGFDSVDDESKQVRARAGWSGVAEQATRQARAGTCGRSVRWF
jgi:adenosine deaminase